MSSCWSEVLECYLLFPYWFVHVPKSILCVVANHLFNLDDLFSILQWTQITMNNLILYLANDLANGKTWWMGTPLSITIPPNESFCIWQHFLYFLVHCSIIPSKFLWQQSPDDNKQSHFCPAAAPPDLLTIPTLPMLHYMSSPFPWRSSFHWFLLGILRGPIVTALLPPETSGLRLPWGSTSLSQSGSGPIYSHPLGECAGGAAESPQLMPAAASALENPHPHHSVSTVYNYTAA
jgi:hypothetical protein